MEENAVKKIREIVQEGEILTVQKKEKTKKMLTSTWMQLTRRRR